MGGQGGHHLAVAVTAGVLKGRVLKYPPGRAVRPTTQRTRASVLNTLGAALEHAVFVDLYAGAGGVGIEALSRGAAMVHFAEQDPAALACLRENLAACRIEASRWRVHAVPVGTLVGRSDGPLADAEIVFADPPYDTDVTRDLLDRLAAGACPRLRWLVIEHRTRVTVAAPAWLTIERSRRFGDTTLTYFIPAP